MLTRTFERLVRRMAFFSVCLLIFAAVGIVNGIFPGIYLEGDKVVTDNAPEVDTYVPSHEEISSSAPKTNVNFSSRSKAEVRVSEIIDGDTFKAEIEISPGVFEEQSVRLRGIDAPERKDRDNCSYARDLYVRSEHRLGQLAGDRVILRNTEIGYYGRIIADVYTMEGLNIGETLLSEGLVRVYQRPKYRPPWC
ncbi:MAG: thermonuclease family protein [Hyphomicrobiales bacterium]|nr:thermonuclease family protein [Hyphomicrobiales bacterium]